MSDYNPHLKGAILEIVENQLSEGDPPETGATLERLLVAGYTRQQAVEMIGTALVDQIWNILHNQESFDQERYVALLDQLE